MSSIQFPVGTWVFWHVTKNGKQVIRVGRVLQVFDPDKTSISVGDIDDADKYLHDTRGAGQDVLVEGMHRYVVGIPDATGDMWHVAIPDPRKMLVLRRAPDSLQAQVIAVGAPVHLRSKGTPGSTELTVDGQKVPRIKKLSIEISEDDAVTMDMQTVAPDLNLQGRIISIEEYDPAAGDTE